MNPCLRFAPMIGFRPGELSAPEEHAMAEHLASCGACQARIADEETLSGMLSAALMDEANRRDFSGFADEVMGRIPEYTASVRASTGSARTEMNTVRSEPVQSSSERASPARPEPVEGRAGLISRILAWARRHRAAAFASAFAPAAAALIVYLTLGNGSAPEQQAALDVSVGDRGAMVLETSDGPIVLLGANDSEGT